MKFDVVDILNKYNIDYQVSTYSNEIDFICPFHNDTNFGNAKINKNTGLFNCFACGVGGSIYHFVALLEKISDKEAYKLVVNNFNVKNLYDVNKLKNIKVNVTVNLDKLKEKVVLSILDKLKNNKNIDFKHRWLIVCCYIKFENISEKQILNMYNMFSRLLHS